MNMLDAVLEKQNLRKNLLLFSFTPDKCKATMESNLLRMIDTSSSIQTDSHKSYSGLNQVFENHAAVNHKEEFVRRSPLGKVTTNTVEGFHGVIKRQARNTNLFAGRSSKDAFLHDKLGELEFRFNIREKGDMFFVFLHALLHVYTPKPCVDIVENQQMVVDIECQSGMQLDN